MLHETSRNVALSETESPGVEVRGARSRQKIISVTKLEEYDLRRRCKCPRNLIGDSVLFGCVPLSALNPVYVYHVRIESLHVGSHDSRARSTALSWHENSVVDKRFSFPYDRFPLFS